MHQYALINLYGSVTPDCPYTATQLISLCAHLNILYIQAYVRNDLDILSLSCPDFEAPAIIIVVVVSC